MRKKYLLDCTLRDGGYINDWEFGHDNIVNIFERVVSSGIDVIEVGFLDDRRTFDINRSIFPDTESAQMIYGKLNKKQAMVVGMIDYGTCDIANLQLQTESFLDGIRVIFKKDKMHEAMEYCSKVKDLGYKVFSQLVSVTSYSDEELMEVIRIANRVKPYALSMVDTYGLLNPKDLTHIMQIIDENLDKEIVLGFHAHNNFQLGYINATTVLDYATDRDVLVDGTLYGMGKSAGNAPIELIALYMNEHYGKNYLVTEMQEAITTSVMDFQRRSPWGYQLFYYIAASNRVHPNYVSHLMNKRTLSVTAINEILQKIPDDQKLEKNIKLVEQLYIDYQKRECNDEESIELLKAELKGKTVLVIGPGSTIGTYRKEINKYISEKNPTIIAINYIPQGYHPQYLFITNATRYLQSETKLHDEINSDIKIIASSNLTTSDREFDYVINYSSVIDEGAEIPDNSMCMLIRTLIRCECKNVSLAGLDGYTPDNVNYFDIDKEYSFLKDKAESLNDYAKNFFNTIKSQIQVEFVTPSKYQAR
ncbi:MAG: aldolase catalytic domain-containing protein [Oscillospiraceae bacterium]|nr:aldolase catalytic domain-containing protein [Oscillospiraceae bacterium]